MRPDASRRDAELQGVELLHRQPADDRRRVPDDTGDGHVVQRPANRTEAATLRRPALPGQLSVRQGTVERLRLIIVRLLAAEDAAQSQSRPNLLAVGRAARVQVRLHLRAAVRPRQALL